MLRKQDVRNRVPQPPSWQVNDFESKYISKSLTRAGSSQAELSVLPESKYGASLKEAQNKSTYDFKQKLGSLKDALSTIKTQLTSFKNESSSQKQLMMQKAKN